MCVYEILKIKIIISKKKEIFKIENFSVDSMMQVKGLSLTNRRLKIQGFLLRGRKSHSFTMRELIPRY